MFRRTSKRSSFVSDCSLFYQATWVNLFAKVISFRGAYYAADGEGQSLTQPLHYTMEILVMVYDEKTLFLYDEEEIAKVVLCIISIPYQLILFKHSVIMNKMCTGGILFTPNVFCCKDLSFG